MSRWKSETFNIESKEQLKSYRKDMWKGLLMQNGLDLEMYPWWTVDEIALESNLFSQADENYEERKLALKAKLEKLAPVYLIRYFDEIGVNEVLIEDWLKTSLVEKA